MLRKSLDGRGNSLFGAGLPIEDLRSLLWVKLGRKLDVRAESAFPPITDIVDYGRDHSNAVPQTERGIL